MPEMRALRRRLEQGWHGDRPHALLRPLAVVYGAAMRLRAWAFRKRICRSTHPGVATIVVGNLTVGGTGKTPLVLWLAAQLRARGRRPGIVLRGYGGQQQGPRLVDAADDAWLVGDEAVLLVRRSGCPVAIGARRAAAAALLVEAGCDLVIADDGLQHLGLRRDLDIIVVDGARGFGNGALLPAGPLRERPRWPPGTCVVVHGEDQHRVVPAEVPHFAMQLAAQPLRRVRDDSEPEAGFLQGGAVHAVAGIGHPQRFFAQLRAIGIDPLEHPFPDHHRYSAAELAFGDARPIVMTEKDAVKCRGLAAGSSELFYLPVVAVLAPADAMRLVDRVLAIGRE